MSSRVKGIPWSDHKLVVRLGRNGDESRCGHEWNRYHPFIGDASIERHFCLKKFGRKI